MNSSTVHRLLQRELQPSGQPILMDHLPQACAINLEDVMDNDGYLRSCIIIGIDRSGRHLISYKHLEEDAEAPQRIGIQLWSFQPGVPCTLRWSRGILASSYREEDLFSYAITVTELTDSSLFIVHAYKKAIHETANAHFVTILPGPAQPHDVAQLQKVFIAFNGVHEDNSRPHEHTFVQVYELTQEVKQSKGGHTSTRTVAAILLHTDGGYSWAHAVAGHAEDNGWRWKVGDHEYKRSTDPTVEQLHRPPSDCSKIIPANEDYNEEDMQFCPFRILTSTYVYPESTNSLSNHISVRLPGRSIDIDHILAKLVNEQLWDVTRDPHLPRYPIVRSHQRILDYNIDLLPTITANHDNRQLVSLLAPVQPDLCTSPLAKENGKIDEPGVFISLFIKWGKRSAPDPPMQPWLYVSSYDCLLIHFSCLSGLGHIVNLTSEEASRDLATEESDGTISAILKKNQFAVPVPPPWQNFPTTWSNRTLFSENGASLTWIQHPWLPIALDAPNLVEEEESY